MLVFLLITDLQHFSNHLTVYISISNTIYPIFMQTYIVSREKENASNSYGQELPSVGTTQTTT